MSSKRMPSFVFLNSKVPAMVSWFFRVGAVTIGPFIFVREGCESDRLLNHEQIHIRQQYEMLFIGQWLLYGLFWLFGLLRYGDPNKAYRENPFEREAYANDDDLGYLDNRKAWSWTKHLRS